MAFTGFIDRNIGTEEGPGTAAANMRTWLNAMLQKDGTDWRVNLSQRGTDYVRWNTSNSHIEFYIAGSLVGYVDAATGFVNVLA